MPEPGDRHPAFIVEPMKCWAMIYDVTMQADRCPERPNWTGRWFGPKGDRWWRVWTCRDHLEGLTGLPEFGQRASHNEDPELSAEHPGRGCPSPNPL
jgi:hypothetical protein